MTHPVNEWARQIAGGKGGKGGKGGSGGGNIEHPNSLRSKQIARVIDLLSEGPIGGIQTAMDIWYDGVPMQNPNGTYNFNSIELDQRIGWSGTNQPLMAGFNEQQAEAPVGVQVKRNIPVVRAIPDTNATRARVTLSVPALQITDKKTGNINGTNVDFAMFVQNNGGGWINLAGAGNNFRIEGKTNTRYQRSYTFALPGEGPWEIRIDRASEDSTVAELQNDLYWDSYASIIDSKLNYNLSAVVGTTIDAEQFQSIPKRVYRVYGLYHWIPNNYDPYNRIYYGAWDGNFQFAWSNNPAWVLFDLILNPRYGLGQFINVNEVDKWTMYRIAQWCDGWVPNGKGGWEPRWTCNVVIRDQQEAFDLINSFAAIFRGFNYWGGGQLVPFADMPGDVKGLYTHANVVGGQFTYQSADIRARHTVAHVTWNDPENLGEPRISVVEDQEGVRRFGIQKLDIIAVGCTTEGQAIRTGKWALFTEQYESETITFRTGFDTAWARPGDIVEVADETISGERVGGRVVEGYTDHIITDAPLTYADKSGTHYLSCLMPDGRVETKVAYVQKGSNRVDVYVAPPTHTAFSSAPLPDSAWIVSNTPNLEASTWRIVSVTEPEKGIFELVGTPYNASKWNYIEQGWALQLPDITNIKAPQVTSLKATDYLIALSVTSIGVRMLVSWVSESSNFEFAYREVNGNWNVIRTSQLSIDVPVEESTYEITVTPISTIGQRGPVARLTYTVVGKTAPPADVTNFRVQVVEGIAMFQWAPSTEFDVIIGGSFEMRYSPRLSGASWASSNTVLTSIPGAATTAELPYRAGSYLIKCRDITGLWSKNPAIISTSGPDSHLLNFFRICESPLWQGNKFFTETQEPQDWLIIDKTVGGFWDDQYTNIDTWPDVDNQTGAPPSAAPIAGTYSFFNRIDQGGVFPTRLTVDMLAFPLIDSAAYVDDRAGAVDDWQDWDDAAESGQGMVTIRVRQTDDDPDLPGAVWSSWMQFISGEYTARAFQFEAWLAAPDGENIAIEELCITADLSKKLDEGADVTWVPSKMHFTFAVKFYLVPAISITIQQAATGDTFKVTNKTREGFDLELLTSAGAAITAARKLDWTAQGY